MCLKQEKYEDKCQNTTERYVLIQKMYGIELNQSIGFVFVLKIGMLRTIMNDAGTRAASRLREHPICMLHLLNPYVTMVIHTNPFVTTSFYFD